MLTRSGVKVLDFCLGRLVRGHGGAAGAGGTAPGIEPGDWVYRLGYTAPEQIEGAAPDTSGDLFAFGAIAYEAFTGRRVFEGATVDQVRTAVLQRDPPPVSVTQPMASSALDRVVTDCLSKDPSTRFQSAGDLRRQLQWIADGGWEGRSAVTAAPSVTPGRRAPWLFLALLLGLLLGGLLGAWLG